MEELKYRGRIDPYESSLLSKIKDISNLKKDLLAFITGKDDFSLAYGLSMSGTYIPVVITGKTTEERSLPPFDLPIMVSGNGKKYIFVDVRDYVNSSKLKEDTETYKDLDSCIARKDSVDLLFRMIKVMSACGSNEWNHLPRLELVGIYSWFFSGLINSIINLNTSDILPLRVVLGAYIYILTSGEEDINSINPELVLNVVCSQLSLPRQMRDKVGDYVSIAIISMTKSGLKDGLSLQGICETCKEIYTEEYGKFFSPSIIINKTKGLWFGPGKGDVGICMMENIPVLISVLESALSSSSFKTSGLGKLALKYKGVIGYNSKGFLDKVSKNFKYL